jgi:hypothetical protein
MKFILFDDCIIVIDSDDIVLEIFNIRNYKTYRTIGSNKNKLTKNNIYDYAKFDYKTFDSWNDLLNYYNINDMKCNLTGVYTNYHKNTKNIHKRFFHINFTPFNI